MMKTRKIRSVLFDLDDTLSIVNDTFMVDLLLSSLSSFSDGIVSDEELTAVAKKLRSYNHSSVFLTDVLKQYIKSGEVELFWDKVTILYEKNIHQAVLSLYPGAIDLITLLQKSGYPYGIISNTQSQTGRKTLSVIKDKYGVDLFDKSLFLDQGKFRKPSVEAYELYREQYSHPTTNDATAYVGNTVGDVQFALNNNLLPFFISIPDDTYSSLTESQRRVLDQAIWIDDLGEIVQHLDGHF